LRADGQVLVSVVAEAAGLVIAHALFGRMWVDVEGGSIAAVALAPVAVLPAHQGRGIGASLTISGTQAGGSRSSRACQRISAGHACLATRTAGYFRRLLRNIRRALMRGADIPGSCGSR
jgi:GNAT superfamily N-acetyltransferase